jgi:ABC-type proline/glycine betaine transport system permease subunit
VAVILCVIIGIPIGVAAGRVDSVWQVIRPVLDAMQVVHSFVYMLPFIFFWGIGSVSATMVTMIFALPPLIRLTNLGVRQVPEDVVEASRAFGAPESRVLFDVQLPLARPAIMTGINQTLLLAISMLGIAAIMGAGGLGQVLFQALSNQDPALAASGGLAFFLVAVVLDRMSQREDSDSGNLFARIRQAWAHRRDPEVLLGEGGAKVATKPTVRFTPLLAEERMPIAITGIGAVVAALSAFLPWTVDAGKFSAYGRRADENLEGLSFSGLDASGGSWFGIVVLALALFVILAVVNGAMRPGRGARWLAADGAAIGAIGIAGTAIAHLLAPSFVVSADGLASGTGLGVYLATIGGIAAVVGSVLWLRSAPHAPLHPLPVTISWGRVVGVGFAALFLVAAMFSGWSFDGRTDVVIDPELEARVEALRERAALEPQNAGPIAAEIAAAMASARVEGALVTDGVSEGSSKLGLFALIPALLAVATTLPSLGMFGQSEHRRWMWSSITAGLGVASASLAFAWIFTHVRSADNNYVSGVGAFMALCGGVLVLASTTSILKELRRAKLYDDEEQAEAPVREPVLAGDPS